MTDDNQAPLNTQVALLRQDFGHMSSDIAEMKQDFKEFRQFYFTKEQAANLRSELTTAHNNLARQVSQQLRTVRTIITGVVIIVLAAVVITILKFGLPRL